MQAEGFHDLVRRAQAGDRAATNELLAAVRPHLMILAREFADPRNPDSSVSDLVQEVELNAWQKLGQFCGASSDDETLAMFRGWIGQMVHNLGLNHERDRNAQKRRPPQPLLRIQTHASSTSTSDPERKEPAARDMSPSKAARDAEQSHAVREALGRLHDATDQEIIRLRFFEGHSLRQIAERLSLTYDQVRSRYNQGMRQLERDLGNAT
jgi:RNA polymerase sigma-70 factor (ECF subfamily)